MLSPKKLVIGNIVYNTIDINFQKLPLFGDIHALRSQ